MLLVADNWKDFKLIDAGDNEKIEQWGKYILRRPDPQAIWPRQDFSSWDKYHGYYERSSTGGGKWKIASFPKSWTIEYNNLKFYIRPTGFKHTGLFPEQAVNWDFMIEKIKTAKRPIKVLNLFAYTGGATVACAYAGAEVCHVDAAKGVVSWAKENIQLSQLGDRNVRFIVDDVIKFVEREIRRGRTYDAIVMDPPVFGRGTKNEVWKIEEKLVDLINLTLNVLSEKPLFYIINSYTSAFSPIVLHNIMKTTLNKKYPGNLQSGELGLKTSKTNLVLPCGIYSRWEMK
ncbi:class I SAM-dependent methyltransferase [Mycoplasmatota bacterium]|nr:class I SAM-dependent methyltransferase [Mycoplasmatota bacterium]